MVPSLTEITVGKLPLKQKLKVVVVVVVVAAAAAAAAVVVTLCLVVFYCERTNTAVYRDVRPSWP